MMTNREEDVVKVVVLWNSGHSIGRILELVPTFSERDVLEVTTVLDNYEEEYGKPSV